MTKINKIVIPAAGYGTRFLPFTKTVAKEMAPIVTKPVIHYIIEDAIRSGITEIILITSSNKKTLEDYFDFNFELEVKLKEAGKDKEYNEIRELASAAHYTFVRQKEMLGNGHAVLQASHIIGNEPFAVVWGDEFHVAEVPHVKQLMDAYEKYERPVLTLIRSPKEEFNDYCGKYGCAEGEEVEPGTFKIKNLIEKPSPEEAPSDLFSVGGYIFDQRVMQLLAETQPGKGGEIWLVDAINKIIAEDEVYGKIIDSDYYDTGSKIGYLKATIDAALRDPEIANELRDYFQTKCRLL